MKEVRIGVDPASSTRTSTDNVAIVTALHERNGEVLISDCLAIGGENKDAASVV